ncbi:MAG: nuclear transport factor 2 family protein [Planctomycetes bacterium]|nr:nuclear transport factor 2 family protein [Planctomycetota bacterium]
MAKKSKKKAARKQQVKKAAKKPSKKPAGKSASSALAPRPISTGKGLSPMEVGTNVVRMFNAGQWADIEEMFWSPKVVSIEGFGVSMGWHGVKAVRAKGDEWMRTHRIHSASAEGPYVGATGFAVKFTMDVEDTASGKRMNMVEVGVYSVLNGKIVQEEFMYHMG